MFYRCLYFLYILLINPHKITEFSTPKMKLRAKSRKVVEICGINFIVKFIIINRPKQQI
jgi:hypothetical protein